MMYDYTYHLVICYIAMVQMALIEIDGLPFLKMVDLSMANCECHNQMVQRWRAKHAIDEVLQSWAGRWGHVSILRVRSAGSDAQHVGFTKPNIKTRCGVPRHIHVKCLSAYMYIDTQILMCIYIYTHRESSRCMDVHTTRIFNEV